MTIASALAAIVTALCLACSEEVVRIIGYAAFPLFVSLAHHRMQAQPHLVANGALS